MVHVDTKRLPLLKEELYLYAPNGVGDLLLQSEAGTEHLYQDGKGSTRLVVNNNGTKTTFDYDAFGNPLTETHPESHIKHRYVGEVLDEETGFYYFRARHYDPKIGRFISRDSFEGMRTTPISLNPYLYAHSDLVNMRDPSEYFGLMDINISQSIQSTLNYMARDYFTSFVFSKIFEGTEDQLGLFDIFTIGLLKLLGNDNGNEYSGIEANAALIGAGLSLTGSYNDHHTIPKYMCGPESYKNTARIDKASHKELHIQMYLFDTTVNVASKAISVAFKKRKTLAKSSPLIELAVKQVGRVAIVKGLHEFYEAYGYSSLNTYGANRTGNYLVPQVFLTYFRAEIPAYVKKSGINNSNNAQCIAAKKRYKKLIHI